MEKENQIQLTILVRQMREQQKVYFRTRTQSALIASKKLEAKVDELLSRMSLQDKPNQQANLWTSPDPQETLMGHFKEH